jgi:RNA polymerase subunit RPABC4/transcription elongation factor Spt4
MSDHQIKCEHCGSWVDANKETCEVCGKVLRAKDKSETLKRSKVPDPLKPQLIKIHDSDSAVMKFFKKLVQVGQLVFYAIVSFLIWVTSWAVG